jgi:hypothetical protein
MSGVATAVVGGAIVGSIIQGNAARGAAQTQADAANAATAEQQGMFNIQQANQKPYLNAGYDALNQIQQNMGTYNQPFTMAQFHEDPGYQFMLQQGQQALQNSAAASGHMISSQQMGNASNYAQNMASNEFGNAFNRYQTQISNSYGRLANIAGLGQASVNGINGSAQNAANNISGNIIGAGNASAAGQIGQANAISSGISNVGSGLMGMTMMNQLTRPSSPSGGMVQTQEMPQLQMPQMGSSAGYGSTSTISSLY